MKILKKAAKYFLLLISTVIFGVFIYAKTGTYDATDEALSYINDIEFNKETKSLEFLTDSEIGFIFYPGGKVEFEAYSFYGAELSKNNINTFIVEMPLDLAIIDTDRALKVIDAHPEVKTWYIGGHSLGGASVGLMLQSDYELFEGVIFMASYPTAKLDSSVRQLAILAEFDGLVLLDEMESYTTFLNDEDIYILEGGNHAGFGMYGKQNGDSDATIKADEQMKIVTDLIINFIEKGE
jgi:hypothetical protein